MRWIALGTFVVLVLLNLREQHPGCTRKKHFKCFAKAFVEGMIGGLIIDSIGVNAGFYSFARAPIYSLSYFGIVVPCWGVFGALINYLWRTVGRDRFLRASVIVIPLLFTFYEGLNLLTGSWTYYLPWYIVAPCWLPLVYTFAGCHRRGKMIEKCSLLWQKARLTRASGQLRKLREAAGELNLW